MTIRESWDEYNNRLTREDIKTFPFEVGDIIVANPRYLEEYGPYKDCNAQEGSVMKVISTTVKRLTYGSMLIQFLNHNDSDRINCTCDVKAQRKYFLKQQDAEKYSGGLSFDINKIYKKITGEIKCHN